MATINSTFYEAAEDSLGERVGFHAQGSLRVTLSQKTHWRSRSTGP